MQSHWYTIAALIISALTGAGGIVALVRARAENRKTRAEAQALLAKTPAEVESISISTMRAALEAASDQIASLAARLAAEEAASAEKDRRIEDLRTQLDTMRSKIADLTSDVEQLTHKLDELQHPV